MRDSRLVLPIIILSREITYNLLAFLAAVRPAAVCFFFFPRGVVPSTDEKKEVFLVAWSIFVLIMKTLSLNHQAKPLPKSLGFVILSDPLSQGQSPTAGL